LEEEEGEKREGKESGRKNEKKGGEKVEGTKGRIRERKGKRRNFVQL